MAETWMDAAGQDGIPCAFVIDKKGKIAFIGHPMELEDKTIDAVLAGNFDVKKAAEEKAQQQKLEAEAQPKIQELSKALSTKDWNAAEKALTEVEKILPAERRQGLDVVRVQILMGKEDWAGAEAKLVELEKTMPEDTRLGLSVLRLQVLLSKGDYPTAYKLATKLSDDNKANVGLQNELAWRIMTDKTIKERDLKLAETAAVRANDATDGKEPSILDTLARAYFMNGKKDKAIETQEKAVNLANGNLKSMLQETLASYKKGELPKE
jgi:tetratricopeptide (TPR) repeat protein